MKKQTIHIGSFLIIISMIATSFSGCTMQENQTHQPSEEVPLETKSQHLVENLTMENFATVYESFNDEMKSALPIKDLQTAWTSLITRYGSFEEIVKTRRTEEFGYNVIYVTCSFSTLGAVDIRFVFDNQSRIAGFQFVPTQNTDEYTPPNYVNTSAFTEENITIGNQSWLLPATLSIPNGMGPFPAVILVHGSGPNDRDETIGPNKPFKDIAQGLASNGVIVLRYDKRTLVYPEECASLTNFTPKEEVIDDAFAAISYLQNSTYVNHSQIFLIGHSLGALMAPEIARETTALKGIILLAAPARPLEDLFLAQYTYLAELDGIIDENEQIQLDTVTESVEKIKSGNIHADEYVFNTPYSYLEYLSTYNAVETTQNLSIPVLILQGKRDYQVTYEDDFIVWQTNFENSTRVTLNAFENLNHLFISGTGTPTNTEYSTPGNVDETVITTMLLWIQNILKTD